MARSAGALLAGLVRLAPFDKLSIGGFMTTTNFLVPPQELVQKWWDNVPGTFTNLVDETELATQAAQWGADQELEATLGLMATLNIRGVDYVRNARRPKRPSLKEQALERLELAKKYVDVEPILRALEALDD